MRYRDVVRQAQRLWDAQETSGWDLAKLTFEATDTPKRGGAIRADADRTLRKWASDVNRKGFSEDTAGVYRRTWERYGEDRLTDLRGNERPFGEHLFAVRHPDKLDLLDTDDTRSPARQRIAEQRETPAAVIAKATPQERIEVVREMLDDPEVVDDPVVRMKAGTLPSRTRPAPDPAAVAAASEGLDAVKSAVAGIVFPPFVAVLSNLRKDVHFMVENDAVIPQEALDVVMADLKAIAEDFEVYAMRHGLEAGLHQMLAGGK